MTLRVRCRVVLVAATVLIAASAARAHHSVPGTFDVNKTVAIKGTISKIDWINPHIYIYVDVKEATGAMKTWKVETLPTNHMRRAGVTKAEILQEAKAGDVTVHMYPALNGNTAGFLLRLTYPEGHFMQLYGDESDIARATR
jgi:hypothetical protein